MIFEENGLIFFLVEERKLYNIGVVQRNWTMRSKAAVFIGGVLDLGAKRLT